MEKELKLIVKESEKLDKNGAPYKDLILTDGKLSVRVRPVFFHDVPKLLSLASEE